MKNTERFSSRVSDYLKYRPSYPTELISLLAQRCLADRGSVIADIGSGTGKLSELLLVGSHQVYGVEPNREMREAAEALLAGNEKFVSVDGESISTRLADQSVDLICAAQAFHWFDREPTKIEFERILKPGGFIALIWNQRDTNSDFQRDYDRLLSMHCAEYGMVNHRNISDKDIEGFFSPKSVDFFTFQYAQKFDENALLGRMFSSSYTPGPDSLEGQKLANAARELFAQHEKNGTIEFTYQTNLYLSR